MQAGRAAALPQFGPWRKLTPVERKALRAEQKAEGVSKSGNLKRKVRAARNIRDRERLLASEALVAELQAKLKVLVEGAQAEPPRDASPGPPEERAGRRTLAWPLAAAIAPVSPLAPIAWTRDPSPELDPLADYVAPDRAATASPKSPEDCWSDVEVPPLREEDLVGITPPGSPPA